MFEKLGQKIKFLIDKIISWFKADRKRLALMLAGLSGLLVIAAVIVGITIYNEGVAAQQDAQKLLEHYERETETIAPTDTLEEYERPDSPEVHHEEAYTLAGYSVIAKLTIENLDLELPVISETDDKALKVSVCHYSGPMPGEAGNMVITGHNFRNGAHFGRLDKIKQGDLVLIEAQGKSYQYEVYETDVIKPDDVAALDEFEGEYALTLLTCTSHGNRRLIVRCKLLS